MSVNRSQPTVLLSGITGFLGSHLATTLLQKRYNVIGLKRKTSSLHRLEPILSDIALYDIEGCDLSLPFQENTQITTVIHTATCYGRNDENIQQVFDVNTSFALQLLNVAISAGICTFINTDTALDKYLNSYSLSKKHFAEWGKYFADKNKITFLNARLEHFYGPDDSASKFTTYIIKGCLENVSELKLTKGEQKRDFIFIDDAVTALLTVFENAKDFNGRFVEFDVGSGDAISIKDFVKTVRKLTGSATVLNFGAVSYREGEVMFCQANPSFLHNLGWEPQFTLKQGIFETIKGMQQ